LKGKLSKIKELLKRAEDELAKYEVSDRFVNMSQACEKTWVAFNLLVEEKSGKEIKGTQGVMNVAYELGLGLLYERAWNLHVLHYEGSVGINESDFIERVRNTIFDVKRELRSVKK
jgi:hypothetical protein